MKDVEAEYYEAVGAHEAAKDILANQKFYSAPKKCIEYLEREVERRNNAINKKYEIYLKTRGLYE
jgi:hypothetical protein